VTKFRAGDDVVVSFDGEDCPGEVLNSSGGWVMCRVMLDPLVDWGRQGPRLAPVSTVCVQENSVRLAEGG
jgi:hypothetical protein